MFRKSFISFVAFVAAFASIAAFAPQVATADDEPTENARTVFKYLKNRDYEAEYDSDGDIVFEYENKYYLIVFDDDDDEYFRIIYANFYTLDDSEELALAYIAAHRVNSAVKGVKVLVPEKFVENPKRIFDAPAIAVESFHMDASAFARSIPRSVAAIQTAAKRFSEAMED